MQNIGWISPTVSHKPTGYIWNGTIGVIYAEPVDDISKIKTRNICI